jgi:hypothetical protein
MTREKLNGWLKRERPAKVKLVREKPKPWPESKPEHELCERYADVIRKMPAYTGKTYDQQMVQVATWPPENIPGEYHVWTLREVASEEVMFQHYLKDRYREGPDDLPDSAYGYAGADSIVYDHRGTPRLEGSKWLKKAA